MTAPALRFGANSKLYRDTASSWGSPAWSEVTNVNDTLDAKPTFTDADSTTRGTGIETSEPTLAAIELSWTMLEDLNDTNFLAMRTAFWTKAVLQLLICSGAYTVSGETYMRGDYKLRSFEKGEPIKGINTYKITAKPSNNGNLFTTGLTPIGSGGLG